MTTSRKWTLIIGTGLLVGLLALAGLVTVAFAQGPATPWHGWGSGGTSRGSWGGPSTGSGRGMMGGTSRGGWGGMMGGGMMGGGMMGGYGTMDPQACHGDWGNPGTGTPLTIEEATERAREYVDSLGNSDLALAEVMEFENNFYAEVKEANTDIHAFELLVNRYTGTVTDEPGPNMMWNTKYGHMAGWGGMGGMMGGQWGTPTGEMTVTPEQALTYAQTWLDANLPGTTVADEADEFYGYYTIHTLENGQVAGMLSVNGYTGAVWYHIWHGDFIGVQAFDHE
ncbi:MAG: hypothetical protein ACE5HA_17145 [Anaerolineae bacterium]